MPAKHYGHTSQLSPLGKRQRVRLSVNQRLSVTENEAVSHRIKRSAAVGGGVALRDVRLVQRGVSDLVQTDSNVIRLRADGPRSGRGLDCACL
jgi:hypothetical protein